MFVAGGFIGGVKIFRVFVFGMALCVEHRRQSPPPPNQPLVVTTMRVFICAVGALGLVG